MTPKYACLNPLTWRPVNSYHTVTLQQSSQPLGTWMGGVEPSMLMERDTFKTRALGTSGACISICVQLTNKNTYASSY